MIDRSKLIAITAIVGGLGLAALGISHAQSSSSTQSTTAAASTSATTAVDTAVTTPPQQVDPKLGGHVGANGVKEELLTGDNATKATAAAMAAVPGGTILRVETDAEGATYEAHMTKADGMPVTVKMDASFKVTSTESGMGMRPHTDASTSSTSSTST